MAYNIDNMPGISEIISRRDFMKLGATAAAALALRNLTACTPGLPSPKELTPQSFDNESVIFNGKVVSKNSLPFDIVAHVDKTNIVLEGIKNQTLNSGNPEGYKGNPLPKDWNIDFSRKTIIVNQTDSGEIFSQVHLGRKKIIEEQADGRYGWEEFIAGLANAAAYSKHSLLVVGKDKYYCFDNVESKTDQGRTRIAVDGETGKIYQITQDSPNPLEKLLKRQSEVTMSVETIDVTKKETKFRTVNTPISSGFLTLFNIFIKNGLREDLTPEEKQEAVNLFLYGSRLAWWNEDELRKYLNNTEMSNQIIEFLKKYHFDIPYDAEELAVINGVLSKKIKDFLTQEKVDGGENPNIITDLVSEIPDLADFNINTLQKLLKERVSLPMGAPELYLLKVKKGKNDKWFLVGRYLANENDVDETILTTKPNAFYVGEEWYTYGEVDREIVESSSLRGYEFNITDFPYDEIAKLDHNPKKDLWGGGQIQMLEARKIDSSAIRFGWDPEEGKIKPGLMIDNGKRPRFLKLSYDKFSGNQIDNLPILSNRLFLPGLGFSPRIIKDVTDSVTELIAKGYETTSLFGLHPMADLSLFANFTQESGGFLDYSKLEENLSPKALKNFVQPGEFFKGGADNSMLVMPKPGEKDIKVYKYDKNTGDMVNEINIDHPLLISPKKVGFFLDDTGYITLSEDKEFVYVVENENTFPLGARTNEKIAAIGIAEIAAAISLLYGGFRLITQLPLETNFLEGIFKFLGGAAASS